jgi:hypothetical protein
MKTSSWDYTMGIFEKWLYKHLLENSKPLDQKIQKMVNDDFWDLI